MCLFIPWWRVPKGWVYSRRLVFVSERTNKRHHHLIVKDLIEIITHIPMYQNDMKMVLDRYTTIQEGFGVKPRHM